MQPTRTRWGLASEREKPPWCLWGSCVPVCCQSYGGVFSLDWVVLAGLQGDVCLSCVQCMSAGPCFCSPDLHFHCYCLIYKTQKKRRLKGGSSALHGLCSELPEFPECVSTLTSLKTQQLLLLQDFFFFWCFSWFHKKGCWTLSVGGLVQWKQPRDHSYFLRVLSRQRSLFSPEFTI